MNNPSQLSDPYPRTLTRISTIEEAPYGDSSPQEHRAENQRYFNERIADQQARISCMSELSNEDMFMTVAGYIKERRGVHYESVQYDDPSLGMGKVVSEELCLNSFHLLSELSKSTDKVYLKRLLEWGLLREAHFMTEGSGMIPQVDYGNSSSDALRKHGEMMKIHFDCDFGGDIDGIVYKLPDEANDFYPREVVEFINARLSEHPNLTDGNFYPPSPYRTMLPEDYDDFTAVADGKTELAIEVSHLFDISITDEDLDDNALERLYQYGVSIDAKTYNRINKIVEVLPMNDKVLFANAYLATEFGDDFGEILLSIAGKSDERRQPVVNEAFMAVANSLRSISRLQEGFLNEVDTDWARDIHNGISTRISEILYELNHRLDSGDTKAWTVALDSLRATDVWAEGAYKMLVESEPIIVAQEGDTTLYHFIHPVEGLLPGAVECTAFGKLREEMTKEEKSLKEGSGARFSITYDPDNRDAALSLIGKERINAYNGRFDKSSWNMATKIYNPDAEDASVSFDLFSVHNSYALRELAKIISDGQQRRGATLGKDVIESGGGAYTYDIIDQKWGNRDIFAGLIGKCTKVIDSKIKDKTVSNIGGQALAA